MTKIHLLIAFLALNLKIVHGQIALTAVHLSPLPTQIYAAAPYYDGASDSIYLFGGYTQDSTSRYVRVFDIATETVTTVAELPGNFYRGTVQADSSGNVYCLGANKFPEGHRDIIKFNLDTRKSEIIGQLPYEVDNSASVKRAEDSDEVLIFGGNGRYRGFLSLNLSSLETISHGDMPSSFFFPNAQTVGGKVLLFGLNAESFIKVDLVSLAMEVVPSTLPVMTEEPTSVYDGENIFFVGGTRERGIELFSPETEELTIIPVEGLPLDEEYYYTTGPTSVYVEKLNRIYYFGGEAWHKEITAWKYYDHVWYVDLNPLTTTPTTTTTTTTLSPIFFTCENRTDGIYPHPFECSMYISCENEDMIVHTCSPPLLFDPVLQTCNFPHLVDCELSCAARPDGIYAHPHDCTLFIICTGETINVYKCPDDMLFDPEGPECTPPQFYQCPLDPLMEL